MVNGIRTIYSHESKKGFDSKFCVGSLVWYETSEEGRRMHWLKHCKYNNKNEDKNYPNILSDKNSYKLFTCFLNHKNSEQIKTKEIQIKKCLIINKASSNIHTSIILNPT